MAILRMNEVDLAGKRVLIREDFNVPLKDGKVAASQRLQAALPTIRQACAAGARVLLMSHLGRPTEGEFKESESLAPVATWLSQTLGRPVRLVRDYLHGEIIAVDVGEVVLLENCRFNVGEAHDDLLPAAGRNGELVVQRCLGAGARWVDGGRAVHDVIVDPVLRIRRSARHVVEALGVGLVVTEQRLG